MLFSMTCKDDDHDDVETTGQPEPAGQTRCKHGKEQPVLAEHRPLVRLSTRPACAFLGLLPPTQVLCSRSLVAHWLTPVGPRTFCVSPRRGTEPAQNEAAAEEAAAREEQAQRRVAADRHWAAEATRAASAQPAGGAERARALGALAAAWPARAGQAAALAGLLAPVAEVTSSSSGGVGDLGDNGDLGNGGGGGGDNDGSPTPVLLSGPSGAGKKGLLRATLRGLRVRHVWIVCERVRLARAPPPSLFAPPPFPA